MMLTVGLILVSGICHTDEAYFTRVLDVDRGTGSLVLQELINDLDFSWGPTKHSLKDFKVYDGTGKLLDTDEVIRRVKPGMALLIAKKGDKTNRDILFSLKKETLVLVLELPPTKDPPFFRHSESLLQFLRRTISHLPSYHDLL